VIRSLEDTMEDMRFMMESNESKECPFPRELHELQAMHHKITRQFGIGCWVGLGGQAKRDDDDTLPLHDDDLSSWKDRIDQLRRDVQTKHGNIWHSREPRECPARTIPSSGCNGEIVDIPSLLGYLQTQDEVQQERHRSLMQSIDSISKLVQQGLSRRR